MKKAGLNVREEEQENRRNEKTMNLVVLFAQCKEIQDSLGF